MGQVEHPSVFHSRTYDATEVELPPSLLPHTSYGAFLVHHSFSYPCSWRNGGLVFVMPSPSSDGLEDLSRGTLFITCLTLFHPVSSCKRSEEGATNFLLCWESADAVLQITLQFCLPQIPCPSCQRWAVCHCGPRDQGKENNLNPPMPQYWWALGRTVTLRAMTADIDSWNTTQAPLV